MAVRYKRQRGSRPNADSAMQQLKYEVADDLGLSDDIERRGFARMTTREVGKIGGHMVKRLVARGKSAFRKETS